MSQADETHTPSASGSETESVYKAAAVTGEHDCAPHPCPTLAALSDIVFDMEDLLAQGLCLTEAMISFVEGRRDTLRVKPNTIYFFAFEVQARFERLLAEWNRLFALLHPKPDHPVGDTA